MNPSWATIADLQEAFRSGKLKAIDAAKAAFDAVESDGQDLNAWTALNREEAFEKADAIDRRRQAGDALGPLAGIPMGIKDMICTRGLKTTAASRMLENFIPPYDATVTSKLRESDALLIGKLNQDEFAFGSSNESSAFGPCKNPFDPTRVPGGSSGGSAAAVAAGHCTVSLGTDTGGSIRQPASFCGVFGLKPTYGRVSRYGVVAFASSLDQVGPLGRTVEDAARVFDVIGGHDPKDSTSLKTPFTSVLSALNRGITGLRIGVPKEYFSEGLDSSVEASVKAALSLMERSGATLVPISLPHTSYAVATYYVLATAEACSNLGRYDGVRYGHRTSRHVDSLEDLIAKSRSEGLGDEAKRRIILGTYVLSSGYYDAYYLKAQKVRTLIKQDFEKAFTRCDIIAAATSPVSAFPLGDHVDDPLKMYLMDILTIPASLAGLPCASQACGLDPSGLPIGLQWIAPPLQEERILQSAHFFESQTDHHRHRPPGGGR